MTENLTIRLATVQDRDALLVAYFDMLRWLDGQDYLFLPTPENAKAIVDGEFIPAIQDGRSGIFIVEDSDQPVAFLFWVENATPLAVRYRTGTSFGQWVLPDYRGHSLVARMVYHAVEQFRAMGIAQVLDMCHVPESFQPAERCGFEIEPKIVVLKIQPN